MPARTLRSPKSPRTPRRASPRRVAPSPKAKRASPRRSPRLRSPMSPRQRVRASPLLSPRSPSQRRSPAIAGKKMYEGAATLNGVLMGHLRKVAGLFNIKVDELAKSTNKVHFRVFAFNQRDIRGWMSHCGCSSTSVHEISVAYASPHRVVERRSPSPRGSPKQPRSPNRISPSQHASQTAVRTRARGNDGRMWIVQERSNGTHFWSPVKKH